jgi:RimJ/RimL family protein N-acetyltransferase
VERPLAPPDPPLHDDVVTLRPWEPGDVPVLVELCNGDDELPSWLDRLPQPYTEQDAREYVARCAEGWRGEWHESTLAIVDAATGAPIGSLAIRYPSLAESIAEVGYWIGRPGRGKGAATSAVRLVCEWLLRDLGWLRIELQADPLNVASTRVAERCGFQLEGIMRSIRTNTRQGRRIDLALYSLLPSDL